MRIRPDIEIANLTDVGCQREVNEDYYSYMEPDSDEEFQRKGRLVVVADGMGGHKGGQVASGLAVEAVRAAFVESKGEDPHTVLVDGFSRAQQSILAHAAADPELEGMGTTCTAAVLRDGQLTYGHIGDSRLYLVRDGKATLLTEDHSYVQSLVKSGAISPEEAATHERRNVLTAALGMRSPGVAADFAEQPIALRPGDVMLLCSDGLHGLVRDGELASVAAREAPYQACRTLVDLAKERGGQDNITVQIVRLIGTS